MLLLFGAVCSVFAGTGPVWKEVWTGQGHIFATLQYMRWAPGWIKLKPEVLQKQVGKLAEEYGAFFVDVTLRDGFIVLQVELFTDIKFLRFLKKEDLAPSIPEVLYFFVKRAKSIQKHLDRNRKNKVRISVSSSVRTAFTALSGTTDASSSCLPVGSTFLLRPRLVLVADPQKNAIQTFLCGGSNLPFGREEGSSLSGIPSVWHPILLGIRRYFTSVSCTSTSQGDFEHSLSGI